MGTSALATQPRFEQAEFRFDREAADAALLATMPEWMRPDQVAQVLGDCSRETVRALRIHGKIDCRDFRTPEAKQPCWRFYRGSVRQYLHDRPRGESDF